MGTAPVGAFGVPGVAGLSSAPAPPTGAGPVPAPVVTCGAAGSVEAALLPEPAPAGAAPAGAAPAGAAPAGAAPAGRQNGW